jgi:hypothetical protein
MQYNANLSFYRNCGRMLIEECFRMAVDNTDCGSEGVEEWPSYGVLIRP